jgi:hypothetical protein
VKLYSAAAVNANANANGAFAVLWTPTRRIRLCEVQMFASGNADKMALQRVSARGTPLVTISGEAEDGSNEAPTAVLDRQFTAEPTFTGGSFAEVAQVGSAAVRSMTWEFWDTLLWVEIGAGIGILNLLGVAGQGHEMSCVWEE